MLKASLKDVYNYAAQARVSIYDQAGQLSRDPRIYLHWSAGHYGQFFDDYHINIDKDGSIYLSTTDFSKVLSHTWRRNTGSIGISLSCAYGANTKNLGPEPPTTKQIETMAQVIAYIAKGLWLTIDKKHVMTHGEAADCEDGLELYYSNGKKCEHYGPKSTVERWDLEYLGTKESPKYDPWLNKGSRGGDILRGKANWYSNRIGF